MTHPRPDGTIKIRPRPGCSRPILAIVPISKCPIRTTFPSFRASGCPLWRELIDFRLGTGGDDCCREPTKRQWNNRKDQAIPIESAERCARHQRSNNSALRYFSAFGFGSLEGCGAELAIFEFISHQAKAQTNMSFVCPSLSSPPRPCTSAPVKAPEGM